ncbi:2Fe-2S ferredoxin [Variovorax boronicumulans]|uniref:cholesterol 7-desaturase n=1 Tax=Variovorax boronicumulans TaxID=436515 RepID=A0A250DSK6_9BURK|nr:Rieske 2Fe-2S domain-containing protein [Variovorax boronicumulans]ATA56989.1 2Fe-2S ferredoxin [Variovorax boronicumulans]
MTEPSTRLMTGPHAGEHAPRLVSARKPLLHTRSASGDTRMPLPYTNGWFAVCFSHEVRPGALITVPFMGQDLVVYRTASGLLRVIEPYCPHLGAHLGHGGTIDGEHLTCAFHGLVFGPDGACVRACPGQTPPRTALTSRYAKEANGVVMVWRHSEDIPPEWDFPSLDLDDRIYPQYGQRELDGYGDAVGENSVDMIHFGSLHGLTEAAMTHEMEQHTLTVSISARWKGKRLNMRLTNFGLGHTRAENEMPEFGLRVTTLVYATPIAPLRWTFRWIDIPSVARFDGWPSPARKLAYRVLNPMAHRWLISFSSEDMPFWRTRAFLKRPALMAGDRSIAAFRRWSAQFYPANPPGDADTEPVLRASAER